MATNVELLTEARRLIEHSFQWIQGNYARGRYDTRDREGYVVGLPAISPNACRFCMSGALARAHFNKGIRIDFEAPSKLNAYSLLQQAVWGDQRMKSLSVWNDATERTHDEVLAAFDEAIRLAQLQETVV